MELKYYLRGLGLGIVVTAVIMGLALSGKRTMTDEEVIARAKTLGMVENTESMLLSDAAAQEDDEAQEAEETEQVAEPAEQEPQEEATEESTEEESVMEENSQTDVTEEDNTEEEDSEDEQAVTGSQENDLAEQDAEEAADAKQPETDVSETQTEQAATGTEDTDNQKDVTITIVSGDSSYSVAKKLADAGVVLTAQSYDAYLCANGYDKKLRTGTFTIPKTASDEQIARIVTGMGNP